MMSFSSSAATRRYAVAMGVSPWLRDGKLCLSPDGTTRGGASGIHFVPLGLGACRDADHGLTPMATAYRPVRTESQERMTRRIRKRHLHRQPQEFQAVLPHLPRRRKKLRTA